MLASCGVDIKFHKWPSGDYHGSYGIPEAGFHIPNISWCSKGELLITTIPSFGPPIIISVVNDIHTHKLVNVSHVGAVAFSKTIQHSVVLGTEAGRILVYDINKGNVVERLPSLPLGVKFLHYAAWDSSLAAGCSNGQICLYDSSARIYATFYIPKSDTLTAMVYHDSDPNLLAAANGEGMVVAWDCHGGSTKFMQKCHSGPVTDVAFSLQNEIVTVGIDRNFNGYDLKSNERIFSCTNDSQLYSVAFAPNAEEIVVGSSDGKLYCYDKRKIDHPTRTILTSLANPIGRLAFQTTLYLKCDEDGSREKEEEICKFHNYDDMSDYSLTSHSSFLHHCTQPMAMVGRHVPASGDFTENSPMEGSSASNEFGRGKNIVTNWIEISENSSKIRGEEESDPRKEILALKKQLMNVTKTIIEKLIDLTNKEFLKLRMASSKEFITVEYKQSQELNLLSTVSDDYSSVLSEIIPNNDKNYENHEDSNSTSSRGITSYIHRPYSKGN